MVWRKFEEIGGEAIDSSGEIEFGGLVGELDGFGAILGDGTGELDAALFFFELKSWNIGPDGMEFLDAPIFCRGALSEGVIVEIKLSGETFEGFTGESAAVDLGPVNEG